jgi:hypothetical protein
MSELAPLRPHDELGTRLGAEAIVKCAVCGVQIPGAMLAEHIKLLHVPSDLGPLGRRTDQ